MSTDNRPNSGSFSLGPGQVADPMTGDPAHLQETGVSVTKDLSPQAQPAVDAYGNTMVVGQDRSDTAADLSYVTTAGQQEFAERLLKLCNEHPIAAAIVQKFREENVGDDPAVLAGHALKILYAGQEDCIPHVQPYFYDQRVIENLFYGDKGLFVRFLGRGGFGSAVLVRNVDPEGNPRNEVWKIAHAPGHYDGKTRRWHSMHTDPSNQMFIERLNREADATAELGKMGISPKLLEQGTIRGVDGNEHPYFATQFVPGMTVKQLITAKRNSEIPSQLTADVGVLFGVQLAIAHKHNYTHRDASKANLYIADDGRPIILDWGLSSHNRDSAMTQLGAIMGTPEIMSPEAAMGGTVNATRESDVYSLAAVLYEMQTRQQLFNGQDSMEIIMKHAKAERDLKPLWSAKTPEGMIKILEAALSIDKPKRPDAQKLASLLWPYSSLYLAHGKISFDEFLGKFDKLGRLQLPPLSDGDEAAIPSKFVTIDRTKGQKDLDDLSAESASVGEKANTLLIQRSTELIRRETRRKITAWMSGIGITTAAAAALLSATLSSTWGNGSKEKEPVAKEVQPDPNAPIQEVFDSLKIERTPDGARIVAKLFEGLPCELTLTEKEVVALWDERGTHAIVWRPNGEQSMKLLGYANAGDFPQDDEKPYMAEKGMNSDCVTFIDPKTGRSMTYISDISSYVVVNENGTGSIYSHRLDIRNAFGPNFQHQEREIVEDAVAREILVSYPQQLATCVNPNSPAPGGQYNRSFAASLPSNIAKQLIDQFPETVASEREHMKTATNKR